jgi:catechol 2,3-dioxygenase-like lactoylglutathione lyase family enzyme
MPSLKDMGIHIDGVSIRCRDLKASRHFYEELLGFEAGQDLGTMQELFAPTGPWPGQADPPPPSRINLMLDQLGEAETANPPGGVYGMVLGITVDDVDAVVEKLRPAAKGVRIEPQDEGWGVRNAAVYDPDGHEIWITGPLKGAS